MAARRNGRALTREDLSQQIDSLKELVQEKIGRTSDAVDDLGRELRGFVNSNRDTVGRLDRRDDEIEEKVDAASSRWKIVGGVSTGLGATLGWLVSQFTGK